jgi:hypothetical protein
MREQDKREQKEKDREESSAPWKAEWSLFNETLLNERELLSKRLTEKLIIWYQLWELLKFWVKIIRQ